MKLQEFNMIYMVGIAILATALGTSNVFAHGGYDGGFHPHSGGGYRGNTTIIIPGNTYTPSTSTVCDMYGNCSYIYN